jgi:hypothetical protein
MPSLKSRVKRLFPRIFSFMSNNRTTAFSVVPDFRIEGPAKLWADSVLGSDLSATSASKLTRVALHKARDTYEHEFVVIRATVPDSLGVDVTSIVTDRVPSKDSLPKDAVADSDNTSMPALSSPSPNIMQSPSKSSLSTPLPNIMQSPSQSPSPSKRAIHQCGAVLGLGNLRIPAYDRVFIPVGGKDANLERIVAEEFGECDILCSFDIAESHQMTIAEFATLLNVIHSIAPDYVTQKYQCYWYGSMVYGTIMRRTMSLEREVKGEKFKKRGKYWIWSVNKLDRVEREEEAAEEDLVKALDELAGKMLFFLRCVAEIFEHEFLQCWRHVDWLGRRV